MRARLGDFDVVHPAPEVRRHSPRASCRPARGWTSTASYACRLGARKASFAPMDTATGETGMEYGGITPIGLPATWPLLVDAVVADLPHVLVGGGRRRGKLIVPGKAFASRPNAVAIEGLGTVA